MNKSLKDIGNYVDFSSDFGMKLHFRNKSPLIGFLNELFAGEKVIEDLVYLKSGHGGELKEDRRALFDLLCTETNGEQFVIEMQQFYEDFRQQATYDPSDSLFSKGYSIHLIECCLKESLVVKYRYAVALQDQPVNDLTFDNCDFKFHILGHFVKDESVLRSERDFPNQFPDCWNQGGASLLFQVDKLAELTEEGLEKYEVNLMQKTVSERVDPFGQRAALLRDVKAAFKEGFEEGFKKAYHEEAVRIALRMKKMGFENALITEVVWLSTEEMEKG